MTPNTRGIITPAEQLLVTSRVEILELMRTVIDKSQQKLSLQLLEVCMACFSVDNSRLMVNLML